MTRYQTTEKWITAVVAFIPGVIVGIVVRLFATATVFDSVASLLWQYLPWMVGFGLLCSILSFRWPTPIAFILEWVLNIDLDS